MPLAWPIRSRVWRACSSWSFWRAAERATAAWAAKIEPTIWSSASKALRSFEYRLSAPIVSASMNSRYERMLATPLSSAARRAKLGQRASLSRSSVLKTSCSRMASRHGPSPVSCWRASTRRGTSSLAAGLRTLPPSTRLRPAWSQPSTVFTASSTIFSSVACTDRSARSARATSANASARSSGCGLRSSPATAPILPWGRRLSRRSVRPGVGSPAVGKAEQPYGDRPPDGDEHDPDECRQRLSASRRWRTRCRGGTVPPRAARTRTSPPRPAS